MTFRKHWLSPRAQPDRAGMSRAEHTERCLEVFTGAVCHVVLDLPFSHGRLSAFLTVCARDGDHLCVGRYQWDMQPTVLRVAKSMRERGFRVWVDTEMMSGSTLDAMAAAVEGAHCVLVCITERYKVRARRRLPICRRAEPRHCLVFMIGAARAGKRQLPARGDMCVSAVAIARARRTARGDVSAA